jgi:hypothetical protein
VHLVIPLSVSNRITQLGVFAVVGKKIAVPVNYVIGGKLAETVFPGWSWKITIIVII